MIYVFDLDGTLCDTRAGDYAAARPMYARIRVVRKLYEDGHTIIISTARGSVTGADWWDLTERQLAAWGVPYHELDVGNKVFGDIYVDDAALSAGDFFRDEGDGGI